MWFSRISNLVLRLILFQSSWLVDLSNFRCKIDKNRISGFFMSKTRLFFFSLLMYTAPIPFPVQMLLFRSPCSWCGSTTAHDRSKCPANKSKCHKCGKLGHFKKVCRSRGVKAVELDNSDYAPSSSQHSGYFLGTVSSNFNSTKPMIDVLVNGVNVKFRVDTGADVTVIPNDVFKLFSCLQM